MSKICPLLAIASTLDKSESSPCECQEERCAWWVSKQVDTGGREPATHDVIYRDEGYCAIRKGGLL